MSELKDEKKDYGVFSFLHQTQNLWLGLLPVLIVTGFLIRAEIREANSAQDANYQRVFIAREEFEARMKQFELRADERTASVTEKLKEIRDEQKSQRDLIEKLAVRK